MAPRIFLNNYKYLFLFLALAIAPPAYGQEGGFFALLDEDRRRELTIEFGLSFLEDPVFRGFVTEESGPEISPTHPATKVNLKTPRHISGTFGWRLNDWLRVEASMNFNSADFGGASSGGALEAEFSQFYQNRSRGFAEVNAETAIFNLFEDQDFEDEDGMPTTYGAAIAGMQTYIDALADTSDDGCDGDEDCARRAAEVALAESVEGIISNEDTGVGISTTTNYSADGTFFSIGSFLSAYADIPITRNFWLYGGGGMGVAWSHVKDGFYQRAITSTVDDDSLPPIQEAVEDAIGIDELGIDNLDTITLTLQGASRTDIQRTHIVSTVTSFAVTASVGMRTALFEGLVFDSGYQIIWTQQGFYRGADEDIAHLLRVGFVFNF